MATKKQSAYYQFKRSNVDKQAEKHKLSNYHPQLKNHNAAAAAPAPLGLSGYLPHPDMTKPNTPTNGGGPMPLRYYDPSVQDMASADAGRDLLHADGLIRPRIGGKRRTHKRSVKRSVRGKSRRLRGGFIPSIMEPFVIGCSKYIAPLAAFSAWKLKNRK